MLGPSGLCSVDVDSPEHAEAVLGALGIDLAALRAVTPTIQGNPARYRLMFKAPPGVSLGRKALVWSARGAGEKPITLLELRAGDIQDVLPPTIHPETGKPYVWLNPQNSEFPPLPEALLELEATRITATYARNRGYLWASLRAAFAGYPEFLASLPEKAGAVNALALGVSKLVVFPGKPVLRQGAFTGEHQVSRKGRAGGELGAG